VPAAGPADDSFRARCPRIGRRRANHRGRRIPGGRRPAGLVRPARRWNLPCRKNGWEPATR
jgi:hypothetical protein